MGLYFHHCFNTLSILLLLSSTQLSSSAEGRAMERLQETSKGGKLVMERAMIGSRPPRCDERCRSCGHCEAVQVPVAPRDRSRVGRFSTMIFNPRDEYSSNYKPVNWKCNCGGIIFNP